MRRIFGQHRPVLALLVALMASAGALLPAVALAETIGSTSSAILEAGTLTITRALVAGSFAGELTGAPQTLAAGAGGTTTFSGFQIHDSRGTGTGWGVTLSAGRFVNTDGSGHDLPLGSLIAPRLAVAGEAGSSAVPGELSGAAAIDNSADGSTGGVVMAATGAAGQGMGIYDFTVADGAPWLLAVPAGAYAGTYRSTVTTTLAPMVFGPAAGATLLFSTDFADMSGLTPLMGRWIIENHQLVPIDSGEHRIGFGSTSWDDVAISVTASLKSGRGYGVYYRTSNQTSISGYCFQFDPGLGNAFLVRRVTNGAESNPIATTKMPAGFDIYTTLHTLTVKVVGDHHMLYVDGDQVLDFHDSRYMTGAAGLRSWDGNRTVGFITVRALDGAGGR
jgi:hypothetical protein